MDTRHEHTRDPFCLDPRQYANAGTWGQRALLSVINWPKNIPWVLRAPLSRKCWCRSMPVFPRVTVLVNGVLLLVQFGPTNHETSLSPTSPMLQSPTHVLDAFFRQRSMSHGRAHYRVGGWAKAPSEAPRVSSQLEYPNMQS